MKQKSLKHGLQKTGTLARSTLGNSHYVMQKGKLEPGVQIKLSSTSTSLQKGPIGLKIGARRGSTRLVGDIEEVQVRAVFTDLGYKVKETANSGATHYDGDMLIYTNDPDYIRAEVKYRNTEGFTVVKKHWEDIKKKSLMHGGTPALITVNKNKEQLITMTTKDLAMLLKYASNE